jgi:hypothetical protein
MLSRTRSRCRLGIVAAMSCIVLTFVAAHGAEPLAPRNDVRIFDGLPTRLYFTGNPHHPTFGREKLAKLLDRYFDGKSPIS